MKEIILVKNGELALKGLNRSSFEDKLVKNIKHKISDLGEFEFTKSQSTMVTPLDDDIDLDEACDRISRVFGIAAFSRACECEKDFEDIKAKACEYLEDELGEAKTFKVEAKRSDKKFPMKSPEISRELGGYILSKFNNLKVDVHNPDIIVTVEVREKYAFVRGNNIKGAGGMPTGTNGRAAILISGGIDSPVAAYMMAKRGIELCAVHFASPPYTSELAEMKVMELLKKVARYSGVITTYVVAFTELQEAIRDYCPEEYFTIIMRRLMMKLSQRVRLLAKLCMRLRAPIAPQICLFSDLVSVWIRKKLLQFHARLTLLTFQFSLMKIVAPCLLLSIRKQGLIRMMLSKLKKKYQTLTKCLTLL